MPTYLSNSHIFGDTDISERVYLVQDIDPNLEDTDMTDDIHQSSIDALNLDVADMQTAVDGMTTAMASKADLVAGQVPTSQLPAMGASLGETSTTAYRGDRGKTAFDHSQTTSGNPHNVTKTDVGLGSVPNTDATTRANHTGSQAISTVTGLQTAIDAKESVITAGSTSQYYRGDKSFQTLNADVVPDGTTNKAYTATEKTKLAGIATGATANTGTVTSAGIASTDLSVSGSPITTSGNITVNLNTTGVSADTYSSVTVDTKGRVTAGTKRSINNAPGRSIVTGTGATGFQVSATRDALVSASLGIVTTASIASGQDGYIVMEIAPTNSATAGDWVEVGRVRNGQAFALAIAIQGTQTISGDIARVVPAGYYAKFRSVNLVGTPSYSYVSGQEILL